MGVTRPVVYLLALSCLCWLELCSSSTQPHIITILLDDLGVTNVGFNAKLIAKTHVPRGTLFYEAQSRNFTPNIDRLAKKGIIFKRHYAYSSCTSSRMSFLSGRMPVHVGVELGEPSTWDGGVNPNNGYEGLSPNITTIAAKLKNLGYRTHHIGKADGFGMATPQHLATGRGFDTSLGYFNHANDFYTYAASIGATGAVPPCVGLKPEAANYQDYWYNEMEGKKSPYYSCTKTGTNFTCEYIEQVLTSRALDVINTHPVNVPLFLFYAAHIPHTPLQVPDEYLDAVIKDCANATSTFPLQCVIAERQLLLAMMKYMDAMVGKIVDALKRKGMWSNTLLLFLSDNGGGTGVGTGGNVFPLRGGKGSDWEGGMRVPGFISGRFIPKQYRRTKFDKMIHLMDWYATFCSIAGGTLCTGAGADPTGDAAGFHPVESVNLWPYLAPEPGNVPVDDPHTSLQLSPGCLLMAQDDKLYKLVTGINGYYLLTSPNYPNCTSGATCNRPKNPAPLGPPPLPYDCGQGCLFELMSDETESNNICSSQRSICTTMILELTFLNNSYYEPFRGCEVDSFVCDVYDRQWNQSYGPFLNVAGCSTCIHTTQEYYARPTYPQSSNECQCYTTEEDCVGDDTCSWTAATQSCDLKPQYSSFTPAMLFARRRFTDGSMKRHGGTY